MKAPEILKQAEQEQQDRADTYDRHGERSIPRTVDAFNAITGKDLTYEHGWLFMTILKAVRSQQGNYREDNYVDGASYFALMGEQAAEDRDKVSSENEIHNSIKQFEKHLGVSDQPQEHQRCPYFTGEPPKWSKAPYWADFLTQGSDGEFFWQEVAGYCCGGIWDHDPEGEGSRGVFAGHSHIYNPKAELAIEKRPEGE